MRIRQTRLDTFYWRPRVSKKDDEGSSYEEWGDAVSFRGESWPASGKAQSEQYGDRLGYIRNLKIEGGYQIRPNDDGTLTYDFGRGLSIRERDGICLYTEPDKDPDYRILSIKAYSNLTLELEHI